MPKHSSWLDIQRYIDEEDWTRARRLLQRELKSDPEDHWLLMMLSNTYYEERQYEKALDIILQAKEVMPQCPMVLWHYAGTLDMLGHEKEAIAIWKQLLRRGVEKIAFGECGEGIRHTESLLNDSRFRIGSSYLFQGNKKMAQKYLEDHLQHRRPGLPSSYSKQKALKRLREAQST